MCPPPRRPVQRQNDLPSWLLHLQYTKCLPGRGAGNEVEKNFVAFFLALVEERHAEQKQLVDQVTDGQGRQLEGLQAHPAPSLGCCVFTNLLWHTCRLEEQNHFEKVLRTSCLCGSMRLVPHKSHELLRRYAVEGLLRANPTGLGMSLRAAKHRVVPEQAAGWSRGLVAEQYAAVCGSSRRILRLHNRLGSTAAALHTG
mmetsp:Transcript_5735/g.7970  ORF Transcript_5735/g.7970 Transcript_5735/m.7970 type:complete len:199 (+) Transcript_5735:126-722(+)